MLGGGGTVPVVSTWAGAVQVHRQPTISSSSFVQQLEAEDSEAAAAAGDSCTPGAAGWCTSHHGAFTSMSQLGQILAAPLPRTARLCSPLLCLAPVSQQGCMLNPQFSMHGWS